MPHKSTSIPRPFRSAHLTIRPVIQATLACFLILQSIVIPLILLTLISIRIVILSEMRLAQHVIGLVYFFEFAVSALVAVGMVFLGQQIELLFYLLEGCVFGHSQDLVVVLAEVYEFLLGTVSVYGLTCQAKSISSTLTIILIQSPR